PFLPSQSRADPAASLLRSMGHTRPAPISTATSAHCWRDWATVQPTPTPIWRMPLFAQGSRLSNRSCRGPPESTNEFVPTLGARGRRRDRDSARQLSQTRVYRPRGLHLASAVPVQLRLRARLPGTRRRFARRTGAWTAPFTRDSATGQGVGRG